MTNLWLRFTRPPKPINIRNARRLLAVYALGSIGVALLFLHAWPTANRDVGVRMFGFCLGALLSTLLYGPFQRVNVSPKYRTAIWTASILSALVSFFVVLNFYGAHALPATIAVTLVGGIIVFAAALIADRMSTLWRESL